MGPMGGGVGSEVAQVEGSLGAAASAEWKLSYSTPPARSPSFSPVSHFLHLLKSDFILTGRRSGLLGASNATGKDCTLSYSVVVYKTGGQAGGSPGQGGGGVPGTWKRRTKAAPAARSALLRGSWSARPRAFPVRISFKYEVDFISPRCN